MPDLGKENTFEQCVSEMALAGFTGCEVGGRYPRDTEVLKKALKLRGISIASAWFSSFLLTQPYEQVEKDFIDHCTFLKAMGAKFCNVAEQGNSVQGKLDVPVFAGKPTNTPEQWKLLADGLNKLGAVAKKMGMQSLSDGSQLQILQIMGIDIFLDAQAQVVVLPLGQSLAALEQQLIDQRDECLQRVIGSFPQLFGLRLLDQCIKNTEELEQQRKPGPCRKNRTDIRSNELIRFQSLQVQAADTQLTGLDFAAALFAKAVQDIGVQQQQVTLMDIVDLVIHHVIPEIGRPKYFTHLPGAVSQVRFYRAGLTEKENNEIYAHPIEKGPRAEDLAVWLDFRDILTVGTHTTEWRHPAVYSQDFLTEKKYWRFKQLKTKAVLPLQAAMIF